MSIIEAVKQKLGMGEAPPPCPACGNGKRAQPMATFGEPVVVEGGKGQVWACPEQFQYRACGEIVVRISTEHGNFDCQMDPGRIPAGLTSSQQRAEALVALVFPAVQARAKDVVQSRLTRLEADLRVAVQTAARAAVIERFPGMEPRRRAQVAGYVAAQVASAFTRPEAAAKEPKLDAAGMRCFAELLDYGVPGAEQHIQGIVKVAVEAGRKAAREMRKTHPDRELVGA